MGMSIVFFTFGLSLFSVVCGLALMTIFAVSQAKLEEAMHESE